MGDEPSDQAPDQPPGQDPNSRSPGLSSAPQTAGTPKRHRVRNVLVGLGVVALVIVAVGIGISLGSKPSNAGSSSSAKASASASTVAKYKSTTDLLAAMAAGGAVCGNAQFQTGSTVQGAQSAYIGCDGASSGDTVLEMFTSHADALAYANRMINSGAITNTPTAEVVGPNWAVNTVPSFATQVQQAVGGQLINGQPVTQSAAPAPAPSPTATVLRYSGTSNWNSPPFTITGNNMTVTYTYSGNQDSNFIADMVANDPGRPSVNRQHHRHLRRHYNDALSDRVRGVAISSGDYGYRELDNQDHDVTSPGPGHPLSLCCTVVRVQSKCQVIASPQASGPGDCDLRPAPDVPGAMLTGRDQLVPRGIGDVTAGTACGRAGAAVRGSRRVHRAFVRRTRAKLPPPQRRDPGNPRPPAAGHPAALLSLGCSRLLP